MPASQLEDKAGTRRRRLMSRNHSAVGDLRASLELRSLWLALAWEDLTQRYRRAALGVSWVAIQFLLMLVIFVLVFGRSSPARSEFEYTIYLATGLMSFTFISTMVSRGAGIFATNGGWIKSSSMPLSVLAYSNVANAFFEMLILSIVVAPLILIQGVPGLEQLLLVVIALVFYALNGVWCGLLFGSLGAWFSDLQQLIPAIMRIAFFATPVFWDYEVVEGRRMLLAHYNPFTHFVEIIRQPLMHNYPSATNWLVVIGISVGGWLLALVVFSWSKRRLAAWV